MDQMFLNDKPELDSERQNREVREFWDLHHNRRRDIEARIRMERIQRVCRGFSSARRVLGIVGAVLLGAALLWIAGVVRGIF